VAPLLMAHVLLMEPMVWPIADQFEIDRLEVIATLRADTWPADPARSRMRPAPSP
jgi:hypothetical protein